MSPSGENDMNHRSAPNIIKEVLTIAPGAWLFGATLLGAIREGKIISWDRDIDLGIDSADVSDEMLERFRAAGFTISGIYRLDMPEMIPYLGADALGRFGKFILKKDGVKVEMCCFTKGLDGRHYYASGTTRFFVLEDAMIHPIVKHFFYDFEANVPKNAPLQLAFVYGDDWRTPREKWYFTPDHYRRREHTIIELRGDDGSRWSKWTGRKVIENSEKKI